MIAQTGGQDGVLKVRRSLGRDTGLVGLPTVERGGQAS